MSDTIEINEHVRVYIRDLDDAPDSVDLEVADDEDPGEYYYEVPLTELGKRLGKRYIRYSGPEGRGFYDTARGELHTRPRRDDPETNENTVKNKIFSKADRILDKYKIYISDASTRAEAEQMAPEWADVQVTEQGAFYYEKLPGQGEEGANEDLDVGDYDVDTQFGKIVADRVLNDDVGDIPVDDFYEYMDQIDDPELVKDALRAEIDGPGRKTGKQFIETRARALDIDLDLFYKDSGPDETGSGVTSLVDVEVDVDSLSDEVLISADENSRTTQDWSVRKMYEHYVLEDNATPTGMGNPDDIPAGTMTRLLEEEVDDPAVLMDFYTEGGYQIRRDVGDHLEEEHGIIPKVETVDSQYRFDLDGMQEYMTEEEVRDLEEGDHIMIDFEGDYSEAVVQSVTNVGVEVKPASGLGGSIDVPFTDVFSDEFYLASALEKDGFNDAGLLDWKAPEGLIERIDDDSVLTRAVQWEEGDNDMDLRPSTVNRLNERLVDVSPPDPEEYGMSEESMNLLHGATWPEWDDEGARKQGTGLSDDLKQVYSDATTEDLRKYKEVCEDNDLDQRADVVNGMLYYREDGDTGIWDVFEYERTAHGNYAGATEDTAERIEVGAEMTMDNLEPHIGAQLAGHIEKFELQQPPSGSSWVGQSQSGGRTMAIDDPYNVEKTTSHEMGHAFHNFLGIENDGYGTIDNRDISNRPKDWDFGAKPPDTDNPAANEFYDEVKDEWEAYKKTMAGESDEANEIRSYQKRHGVELMAVGFAHWNMDPYKLRNRHPGLAETFDKHLGDGVVDPVNPGDVEEEQYYEVAKESLGRVTVQVNDVSPTSDGGYVYDVKVVDGPQSGTRRTFNSRNSVFEAKSDEYEPLDLSHGMKYTVESGGEEKEVYIDRETRAMGGDFMVRDSMGNTVGQWTKDQFESNLVERSGEEGEVPWSPDRAEKGDLVEMHGVEVNVQDVDTFNGELTLKDNSGERRTLSFDEVNDLRESGDFEPVENVVDWEEMNSNNSYQFVAEDARYNGEVVGMTEDTVTITQEGVGESTIDRDEVEEIRRRA